MISKVGTKRQVFIGSALRTSGGLQKADLMQNSKGRIVSLKQHQNGLKAIVRLRELGYIAKKGEFKLFRKGAQVSSEPSNESEEA